MTSEPEEGVAVEAAEAMAAHVDPNLAMLREALIATNRLARRFSWSVGRVRPFMPMDAAKVDTMDDEDEERLDAFLLRFNSLTAMIQDHITKALLKVEEEFAREMSRKDQRLVMEKLGALKPSLDFGTIAELRNKIAHTYPDESEKQAEVLNEVFAAAENLLDGYNSVLAYSDQKHFKDELRLNLIELTGLSNPSLP